MAKRFLYIVLLTLFLLPEPAAAMDTIRVNTSIKPPFSTKEETGFFDVLLKELGNRMGKEFKLVRQPPERALVSINSGESDMELPRIAGIEKKYTNLVMVPEKVIDYHFVAFSRKRYCFKAWDDLKDKRVGYLIGWKIFEKNVPAGTKVNKLSKPDLLFDMLAMNRIDVALYEKYAGWHIAKSHGYDLVKECDPPLAVKPMYIYLHNSRRDLAADIALHLQQMKADGTYQRILNETLN